jgi:hypothetical protein
MCQGSVWKTSWIIAPTTTFPPSWMSCLSMKKAEPCCTGIHPGTRRVARPKRQTEAS